MEIILHFYFPFKVFPKNERERERARARGEASNAISPSWDRAVDRNLAFTRSRWIEIAIDGEKGRSEIAPLIAISPSRDRAGSRSRSTAREEDPRSRDLVCRQERKIQDRDQRFMRSRRRSRSWITIDDAIVGLDLSSLMIFFWVVACVFLDLCFPYSFPNTRKYFPENFLKCNQTHGNIFLFWKLAFPENMYFPENVLQQPNTA